MNFLFKFFILLLSFQYVVGKSYYQKQLDKRKMEAKIKASNERNALINFCNLAENYNEAKCVSLRAEDAAKVEAQKATEKRKVYCMTHKYEHRCINEFGLPNPWNWIVNMILCIPIILILVWIGA
jgi:hypothetical protein